MVRHKHSLNWQPDMFNRVASGLVGRADDYVCFRSDFANPLRLESTISIWIATPDAVVDVITVGVRPLRSAYQAV